MLLAALSNGIWGEPREIAGDTILAVTKGENVVGIVAFHNYDAHAGVMEMSAAAETPRWLSRKVLAEMFGYVFEECGCQAAVLRCDPKDKRMERIATAYGFKRYEIPRLRGRDKSEAIYVLGDDEWRANGYHRKVENGQKFTKTDATA